MKLSLVKGYLLLEENGTRFLMDTGSPCSFGHGELRIFGKDVELADEYLFNSVADLARLSGVDWQVLLGLDVLEGQVFKHGEPVGDAIELPLETVALGQGINLLGTRIKHKNIPCKGSSECLMFFDTGAALTFLHRTRLQNYPVVGEREDFHPSIGKFTTPLYRVPIEFAGQHIEHIDCGQLPEDLERAMLDGFAVSGILGTEILVKYPFVLDLRGNLVSFYTEPPPAS